MASEERQGQVTLPSQPAASQYTSEPSASQHTSEPSASQHTGEPSASQHTSEPSASQHTSEPSASQHTSEPSASQHTSEPSASQHTSEPSASQHTSEPSASQHTSEPSASQHTSEPSASQHTSEPSASHLGLLKKLKRQEKISKNAKAALRKIKKENAALKKTIKIRDKNLNNFFSKDQMKAIGRRTTKGMKWNNDTIKKALKIRFALHSQKALEKQWLHSKLHTSLLYNRQKAVGERISMFES